MATYNVIVVMHLVVLAKTVLAIEETRPTTDLSTYVGTTAAAVSKAATFDNYTAVPLNTSLFLQTQEQLDQQWLLIQYCVAVTESQYDITGLKQNTCFTETNKEYIRRCKTRTSYTRSLCSILKRNLRKVIELNRNQKTRGSTATGTAVCVRKAKHQIYNVSTHICCGRHITTRKESDQCCRKIKYDRMEQICCNSVALSRLSNDTACCGKQAYDQQKQFCRNKIVHTRQMTNDVYKTMYQPHILDRLKTITNYETKSIYPQLLHHGEKSKDQINALPIIVICIVLVLVSTTVVTLTVRLRLVKNKNNNKPNAFNSSVNTNGNAIIENANNIQSEQGVNIPISNSNTLLHVRALQDSCVTQCEIHEHPNQDCDQRSNNICSNIRTDNMADETVVKHHNDCNANITIKEEEITIKESRELSSLSVAEHGSTNVCKRTSVSTAEHYVSNTSSDKPKFTPLLNNGMDKPESICSYSYSLNSYQSEVSMTFHEYENIIKPSNIKNINCTESIFRNEATQTLPFKKVNKLNSFGNPFKFNEVMTKNHRTIMLDNSDVKMTLPKCDMNKHDLECFADSFSDISSCRRKLGLTGLEQLTAPVVEYDMLGEGMLDGFAIIKIPVGNVEDLHVLRFESDAGEIDVAKRIEVPILDAVDESLNTFCILSRKKRCVYIYTKVFSIYTCICYGQPFEKKDFYVKSWLFGKMIKLDANSYSADIVLYLLDNLFEFKDYNHVIVTNENENGRNKLKDQEQIKLFDEVSCTDLIESYLNVKTPWKHMVDEDEPTIDSNHKMVTLHKLCRSFQEASPYSHSWIVESDIGELTNSFRGFVYVKCWRSDEDQNSKKPQLTQLAVLTPLQQQSNLDKSNDIKTICGVVMHRSHMNEPTFKRYLIGELTITAGSLRDVLTDLSKLFKGDAFNERVANALKRLDLRWEMVELNKVGIIPDTMLPEYVRRELKQLPACSMDNRVPRKPIEDAEGNTFYPLGCFTDKSCMSHQVIGVQTEVLRGEFDSDEYSYPFVKPYYQSSQHVSADNIAKHLGEETKHPPENVATIPTLSSGDFAIFPPAVSDVVIVMEKCKSTIHSHDGSNGAKLLSKSEPAMHKSDTANQSQTDGKATDDSFRYDPSLPTHL